MNMNMEQSINTISNLYLFVLLAIVIIYVVSLIIKKIGINLTENKILQKLVSANWRRYVLIFCNLGFIGAGIAFYLTIRDGNLYITLVGVLWRLSFVAILCAGLAAQVFILNMLQYRKLKSSEKSASEQESVSMQIASSEHMIYNQFEEISALNENISNVCIALTEFEKDFTNSAKILTENSNVRDFEEAINILAQKIGEKNIAQDADDYIDELQTVVDNISNVDTVIEKLENFSITHGKEDDSAVVELRKFETDIQKINSAYVQIIGTLNNNDKLRKIYESLEVWFQRIEYSIKQSAEAYLTYTENADENIQSMVDSYNSSVETTAKKIAETESESAYSVQVNADALELLLNFHPSNEKLAEYWYKGKSDELTAARNRIGQNIADIQKYIRSEKASYKKTIKELEKQIKTETEYEVETETEDNNPIIEPETAESALSVDTDEITQMYNYFDKAYQGDADAQYTLGIYYYNGTIGLEKNLRKSVEWFKKAAAQGHSDAQSVLEKLAQIIPTLI